MTLIFSKIYKKWQIFGDARAPLFEKISGNDVLYQG